MSRLDKVNSTLQALISQFLEEQREVFAPYFLTVKKVEVTRDLKHAKVWIAILGEDFSEQEILTKLEFLRPDLQSFVGQKITFKFNPRLRFLIDRSGEKAQRIEEILKRLKQEK